MDCVALAILVNESKYRPLITCFAESGFFFFAMNMFYDEVQKNSSSLEIDFQVK
jgi:hypothetical protein